MYWLWDDDELFDYYEELLQYSDPDSVITANTVLAELIERGIITEGDQDVHSL